MYRVPNDVMCYPYLKFRMDEKSYSQAYEDE